mmetsp:Transcript_48638/g.89653  ORF Transcript_48638/g.89653 Transcript_48638/m.89653 type:complete len:85 (-) Transcript_48638:707-961(-)
MSLQIHNLADAFFCRDALMQERFMLLLNHTHKPRGLGEHAELGNDPTNPSGKHQRLQQVPALIPWISVAELRPVAQQIPNVEVQ